MNMIETVARAIYMDRNGVTEKSWGRIMNAHKAPYIRDARAAIEAMKIPTEAMKDVINEDRFDKGYFYDVPFDQLGEIYTAMISKALEGGE